MKKIELTSYEANDLVRILNYAIEKKKEDFNNGKINRMCLMMEIDDIRCIMARIPKEYIERVEHRKGRTKLEKLVDEVKKNQQTEKDNNLIKI